MLSRLMVPSPPSTTSPATTAYQANLTTRCRQLAATTAKRRGPPDGHWTAPAATAIASARWRA
jgi:hypothetical protein